MQENNKIKRNIPNIITLLNLFSGCISITFALSGNLTYASIFIGLAAIFDYLDGMAARLFKAYSELGKQLDSLADLVSFGVAPSAILYIMLTESISSEMRLTVSAFVVIAIPFTAFFISVFSAIRLARFNLDTRQSEHFIGLPVPANAIFFASLPLIFGNQCHAGSCLLQNTWFLIAIIAFHCYLMVSPIPLISFKFKNLSFRENKIRFLFIGISAILMVILRFKSIPIIIYLYLMISSLIKWNTKDKES
ncbi:MAG: CDP-diacylglycerol--serine O-phosphatidyltransferase [Bacteroidia bacterium]|nr:CDP-diacylglycerol--serine O-phosphatidyltransferase [Bacteroidia bacterium]